MFTILKKSFDLRPSTVCLHYMNPHMSKLACFQHRIFIFFFFKRTDLIQHANAHIAVQWRLG